MRYADLQQWSITDPNGFWLEAAKAIDWTRAPETVLDATRAPLFEWFKEAELNACWNALDRHVEGGRADQVAVIYDSPMTGTKASFTYRQMRDKVAALAGAMAAQGVRAGDRVVIYMPMVPEALEAMLACAPVRGDHPLYILYTSGTTGQPKGVVRATGGYLVALAWTMKNHYNVNPGEVFWTASDVGWVVGHSYICYGPLIHGATTLVFEGKPVGTPDAGTFWRVIEEHGVVSFFTAPTAFRAIKREDPGGEHLTRYDTTSLRALYLAGERADPDTVYWAQDKLKVPVVDHWWQTETGWPICGNPQGLEPLPVKVGSPSVPMPGYDVRVLDEGGHPVAPGTLGAIAIRLPMPPGTLPTLWNAEARFVKSYLTTFPGYYETGDAGYIDEDGYVYIMARTDDVINVAGHRLSTGAMEEVLASHPDVGECAVIGIADALKGQAPLGLLCLNKGVSRDPAEVVRECVALVRDKIGPVAAFKLAVTVDRLPKTRSGKILRATMAKIADGQPWTMPATIDDPATLDEIAAALAKLGLPQG